MHYRDASEKLSEYRSQIAEIRAKMRAVQAAVEPEEVQDYAFATLKGSVSLSELFGAKDDLIVIHNMGRSCPYCTLWADGYNNVYLRIPTQIERPLRSKLNVGSDPN